MISAPLVDRKAKSTPRRFSHTLPWTEQLLRWAEPTIRQVCRTAWRRWHPSGLELEDLYQEARIAVFLAAQQIREASEPLAMVKAVVWRQARDVLANYRAEALDLATLHPGPAHGPLLTTSATP